MNESGVSVGFGENKLKVLFGKSCNSGQTRLGVK